MENSGQLVAARLVQLLLLACPALFFLVRALESGPRSRRLANLALFFGLSVFAMHERVFGLSPGSSPEVFLSSGVVRVLLGFAGIGLAVAALMNRRDGGVGLTRPIVAVGFSILH